MLSKIKNELLNNPEKLKQFLELYEFANIKIRSKYISFGRDKDSSAKSLVIKLENNSYLYITDYPHNINQELFSYICNQKNVNFANVINNAKSVLGITDIYTYFNNNKAFGGFYSNIKNKKSIYTAKTYDCNILNSYSKCGNIKFLKDNISLKSQKHFGIGYDIESQSITIPIKNQFGEILGIKERRNYDSDEDGFQKYFYSVACRASNTLYGYSDNYKYLVDNTIYIFEAEKSVMQCFSYGIYNAVALGSGSLSIPQAKMICELNPKNVIFCHDQGYDLEAILKNIDILKKYSRFSEFGIGYWNWTLGNYSSKISPSDLGGEKLKYIIENEIVMVVGDMDEEI